MEPKRSRFRDHHIHGREGVRFCTRLKTVTSRWPSEALSRADFVIPKPEDGEIRAYVLPR